MKPEEALAQALESQKATLARIGVLKAELVDLGQRKRQTWETIQVLEMRAAAAKLAGSI